jgi:parvulin-like peptidyl-prolyl isomerase
VLEVSLVMSRVAFVVALVSLSACASSTPSKGDAALPSAAVPADKIGEVLATVDGVPIGASEFDQLALRRMGREGKLTEAERNEVIDRLVEEKLLWREALRLGIDKDPKIQKVVVNTLLKDHVYADLKSVEIADADALAYFEAHKDDFVVPEKVQVKMLFIPAENGETKEAAQARAADLRKQVVEKPGDFRKIAIEHSRGAYGKRGGDLGFVTKEGKPGVVADVIAKAFETPRGETSEPFWADEGWNIVYVPNRRERVERSFEQVRGSVLRKIRQERYETLYADYVARLRQGANVSIDQAKLSGHEVKAERSASPFGLPEPAEDGDMGEAPPAVDPLGHDDAPAEPKE